MTYKLPEPDLYAHELLDNGGGVWLGVEEKGICEQAHVDGETGEEIRSYYTEAKMQAAYAEGQRDMLERAIALFAQPHVDHAGAEIVDKLKELLND